MLTTLQFKELFPLCKDPDGWVKSMEKYLPRYEINTNSRISAFIAQCGHESGGWRVFRENLNYSEKALLVTFRKYFQGNAREYARQPEKIANHVYASRMGNGPESSGDGWKYRGRGPIQLTGKDNYMEFRDDMDVDITNPDVVADNKDVAILSAIWFWMRHNLNTLADQNDIRKITKIINGGYNGLENRIEHFNRIMKVLSSTSPEITVLKKGSRGELVKKVQRKIGIYPDGIFGNDTKTAVIAWQILNKIEPTGIVDNFTAQRMFC